MIDNEFPPLEDVWFNRQEILDRVWMDLNDLTVNPDTRLYFYSCIELRFFIEQIFFELLRRLKKGHLTKRELKIYRPKEYAWVLKDIDSDFLKATGTELGFTITKADLLKLLKLYGQLGHYLHFPKQVILSRDQEPWKSEIEQFVYETCEYLRKLSGCR